jgi:hypothetical protein
MALTATCLLAGIAVAAEVTLVKYDTDKKAVTVKEEGKGEKTYSLTDKTAVTFVDREGNSKKGTLAAATKLLSAPGARGKLKLDLTTEKDSVTELKLTMPSR